MHFKTFQTEKRNKKNFKHHKRELITDVVRHYAFKNYLFCAHFKLFLSCSSSSPYYYYSNFYYNYYYYLVSKASHFLNKKKDVKNYISQS